MPSDARHARDPAGTHDAPRFPAGYGRRHPQWYDGRSGGGTSSLVPAAPEQVISAATAADAVRVQPEQPRERSVSRKCWER